MIPYDADQCVQTTVSDMLDNGEIIHSKKENSYERLYYSTGMLNPRARVMTNPHRQLNIVTALARFVWLISGNNRVEDIAYYEPKVRGFSDDGLTVPGSDYGMRIVQPRPGLNQLQGVVDRLSRDGLSRQAAAVVWQPEDAVRESRDIPCTFGMFFHVRKDRLLMSVNMRSNNAFRILPFNLFEFTMLQELIASELFIDVGTYNHWAASMHVYVNEFEIKPTRDLAKDTNVYDSIIMPTMPHGSFEDVKQLAIHEAWLRHLHTEEEFIELVKSADNHMRPYWFGLFSILVYYVQKKRGWDCEDVTNFAQVDFLRDVMISSVERMLAK